MMVISRPVGIVNHDVSKESQTLENSALNPRGLCSASTLSASITHLYLCSKYLRTLDRAAVSRTITSPVGPVGTDGKDDL